jgi:ABC-type nickel/cobalt efflux system permease component RcnA
MILELIFAAVGSTLTVAAVALAVVTVRTRHAQAPGQHRAEGGRR